MLSKKFKSALLGGVLSAVCLSAFAEQPKQMDITFKVYNQTKFALTPVLRTLSGQVVARGPDLSLRVKHNGKQPPVTWSSALEKDKSYHLAFEAIGESMIWPCRWSFNPDFLRYSGLTTLTVYVISDSPIQCKLSFVSH